MALEILKKIIKKAYEPVLAEAEAFAPVNIALSKYWGKRQATLNLPYNSSVSMSLDLGAKTKVSATSATSADLIIINNKVLEKHQKISQFLDLFRPHADFYFKIESQSEVPVAAGFASSASGYAALVLALNRFFGWHLEGPALSVLARLGSGSACRSIYSGFVLWERGRDDELGLDSFAKPLNIDWPELKLGLCISTASEKYLDSRTAMQHCAATSPLFPGWVQACETDCSNTVQALLNKDFEQLGRLVEANALMMHAVMQASRPAIIYSDANTLNLIHRVRKLREEGLQIYFTQDAGPNLKLLFLEQDTQAVTKAFNDWKLIVCKNQSHKNPLF
ncbi:MAG: diphosphomevalonate decarboxylase [Gammaproteobacteria bacterium]